MNKNEYLSEDEVKNIIKQYLVRNGWNVEIAYGKTAGIDIDAKKEDKRWIIEVKGCGSRYQMRRNYFFSVLGDLLQRMNVEEFKYSIAFPKIDQFEKLWENLPNLAKTRTTITCLFADFNGNVIEK